VSNSGLAFPRAFAHGGQTDKRTWFSPKFSIVDNSFSDREYLVITKVNID